MYVRIYTFAVIFLSIHARFVHNFFLPWGGYSSSLPDEVEANVNAASATVEDVAQQTRQGVEEMATDVQQAAADAQYGLESLFGRVRSKFQDIRTRLQNLFDWGDDFNASAYVNELLKLAPEQLAVVGDMLSGWSERAKNFAENEWNFRRSHLKAAKEELKGAINALSDGNYDVASDHFRTALVHLRDESAIYRALQYALNQDESMLPLISDLSYSILDQLDYDLSKEV